MTIQATTASEAAPEIEAIACKSLGIPTLATRGQDGLDFHDLPVWRVREALEAAYEAGRKVQAEPTR